MTLPRFIQKFYTNLSCSNLTPVPPEVLHGLISRWPYPGSSRIFTRTYPAVTLPRFLQKYYTDLSQGNPTPVPPKVLHGFIPRWPYPGSSRSFTQTYPKKKPYTGSLFPKDEVLHGLVTQKPYTGSPFPRMMFYTDSSSVNPTQMQLHTGSSSVNPTQVSFFPRCSFTRAHHQATLHRFPLSTHKIITQQTVSKWHL